MLTAKIIAQIIFHKILFISIAFILILTIPKTYSNTNPTNTTASSSTIIDVLVLFSPEVSSQYEEPTLKIRHLFTFSNTILQNSGTNVQLRVTHQQELDFNEDLPEEQTLRELTQGLGSFSSVAELREEYGADLVVLYRSAPYREDNSLACGLAWVGGSGTNGNFSNRDRVTGFSYSSIQGCIDTVTIHEIGHNFGLSHSHIENNNRHLGTFNYSVGHGVHNEFSTIMSSAAAFNISSYGYRNIALFSNPTLNCLNLPCGVEEGYPKAADAAKSIRKVAPKIAAYTQETIVSNQDDLLLEYSEELEQYTNSLLNEEILELDYHINSTAIDILNRQQLDSRYSSNPVQRYINLKIKQYQTANDYISLQIQHNERIKDQTESKLSEIIQSCNSIEENSCAEITTIDQYPEVWDQWLQYQQRVSQDIQTAYTKLNQQLQKYQQRYQSNTEYLNQYSQENISTTTNMIYNRDSRSYQEYINSQTASDRQNYAAMTSHIILNKRLNRMIIKLTIIQEVLEEILEEIE